MKRILQREAINIIKCSYNAFLGLSLNHQPYIEMIKYNYDYDKNCLQLIFEIDKNSKILEIVRHNAKSYVYIICDNYIINIKGIIYYTDEDDKLIFVCENIEGFKS